MKEQLASLGVDIVKTLSPILVMLLGYIGVRVKAWIDAKIKNDQVNGILTRLDMTTIDAVKEVFQTFVSGLTVNGALSKEDALKARDAAVETAKAHLGAQGIIDAKKILGLDTDDALTKLIVTKIEAHVHDLKAFQVSVSTTPSPGASS